jgi:hypothetical protein
VIDVVYDPADHDNVAVAAGFGQGGNVQVQVVRRSDGHAPGPMPTVTVNGQVVSPGGSAATPDVADEIAKLGELRDKGLPDHQYDLVRRLAGGSDSTPSRSRDCSRISHSRH